MNHILEILTRSSKVITEKCISASLSGTFRLGSRSFLVCFSFTLRSNFAPDRLQIGSSLVHRFSGLAKKLFKIFRINFNPEILNYRARPPRSRKVSLAYRHSVSVGTFQYLSF
jgi:hypothetical protein